MKSIQKLPKFGAKESTPNPDKEQDALQQLKEFLSRPARKNKKISGKYLNNLTEVPLNSSLTHIFGTRYSNHLYLFPEEACYLIDKQNIDVGLSSSEILCSSDISINDYVLYCELKRRGYVVRRRNEEDFLIRYLDIISGQPIKKPGPPLIFECFNKETFTKRNPGLPDLSIASSSLDSPVLLENISIGVVENGTVIAIISGEEVNPGR